MHSCWERSGKQAEKGESRGVSAVQLWKGVHMLPLTQQLVGEEWSSLLAP